MVNAQRNIRFFLESEENDNVWTLEAVLEPINKPIDLARTERTISIEPLIDAPIVPTKSAEAIAQSKPQFTNEAISEINIATLILGGLMIGSICFSAGYIIATEQHRANTWEALK